MQPNMNLPTDPSSSFKSAAAPFTHTCPHLGLMDDRATVTLFPTEDNLCFHCKPPAAPNAAYQTRYCLSMNFDDCALKQQEAPGKLPAASRWPVDPAVPRAAWLHTAGALGISLLLAFFFILWLPGIISDLMTTFAPTPVSGGNWPTLTPSATSELIATQLPVTITPSPFPTATKTVTSVPTPAPQLIKLTVAEMDFGVNCRAGPDTSYASLIVVYTGDELEAFGRDETDQFFAVRIPNQGISECWLMRTFVNVEGDTDTLPILTPAPTP
jgi:hypothetical protein